MNGTDNTFEFLIEYITAKVVGWIMRDRNTGLEDAMLMFHNSETFDKLCDRDTGMYIESPAYIYDTFQLELQRGTIRGLAE